MYKDENICAIVVSFFPDDHFPERLSLIQQQFPLVIIVDNTDDLDKVTRNLLMIDSTRVRVIQNSKNLGIATALNQGIQAAHEAGFNLFVTFDQDSVVKPNLSKHLLQIYFQSGNNAIIGCNFWHELKNRPFYRCQKKTPLYVERKTVISSGMLIPLSIFEKLGGFNESFFIDAVDHEYCLRARKNGYRILISCESLIDHPIGAAQDKLPQWIKLLFPNRKFTTHPFVRKYYYFRNTTRLLIAYFFLEPAWCLRQLYDLLMKLLASALLEEHKWAHIKACTLGLLHGINGKSGPAPDIR